MLSQFHNFFFMKLAMLKMCSSSIEPKTWTTAISTISMNFESLSLRIGDLESLCHNMVSGLRSLSSHKNCLELCPIIILK